MELRSLQAIERQVHRDEKLQHEQGRLQERFGP